jgi:hypothetical protein
MLPAAFGGCARRRHDQEVTGLETADDDRAAPRQSFAR